MDALEPVIARLYKMWSRARAAGRSPRRPTLAEPSGQTNLFSEKLADADYCTRLDPNEIEWPKDLYGHPDDTLYCVLYHFLDFGEVEFAVRIMGLLQLFAEDHFMFCDSLAVERGSNADSDWIVIRRYKRDKMLGGLHPL